MWTNLISRKTENAAVLAMSNFMGIILIGLGAIMGLLAVMRFIRIEKQIETNTFRPAVIIDALFGLILFVLSAVIFYYILNWHNVLILEQYAN